MRVNKIWSNDNARWTVKKRSPTCRKRKYISQVKFSGRRHKIYNRGYKLFYERILLLCKQLLSVIESYRPTITTLEIRDVTIRHRISAGASSTLWLVLCPLYSDLLQESRRRFDKSIHAYDQVFLGQYF